jgi:hypothetical protein
MLRRSPLWVIAIVTIVLAIAAAIILLEVGVKPSKVAIIVALFALVANVVYVAATLRLAEISEQSLGVAERSLEAQVKPIILDVALDLAVPDKPSFPGLSDPVIVYRGGVHVAAAPDGQARCSLPVINLGRGPARITGIIVRLPTRDGQTIPGEPHYVKIERPNLPPEHMTRINFAFQSGDPGWSEWYLAADPANNVGRFSVDVDYTDYAGDQRTTTTFVIAHDPDGEHYKWGVETTDLRDDPA